MRPTRFSLLVLVLWVAVLGGCKKDTPQAEIDFGPDGGFQLRTGVNLPMGGDATDWTADGTWNSNEKQLFASLNLPLDAAQQSGTWYSSVYPNPSDATTSRTFVTTISRNKPAPTGARLAYVIVDKHYAELLRGEAVATQDNSITLAPGSLAAGALYRLYYVCYVPGQQVYYRSHGDIKVE